MPDTFTATLNLVKPAAGSLDWAPKINGNQDIIDTMGNRITALEGVIGGAVAGVTRMVDGATWPDLVTAFNNAPNNPAARHLILLPPTTPLEQTASMYWYKHVDLRGSTSASEIIVRSNVSLFGSSVQFLFGAQDINAINGLIFSDFKVSQDRVSGGAGMRCNPFTIGDFNENIVIKNIDFADVTANGIQINSSNANYIRNIFVLYCNFVEWYEAAIIIDGCNTDGVYLIKNTGVTSAASPLGGVSRPQGIFIGNEQAAGTPPRFGTIENVVCAKNEFDFRPMGGGNGQTLGITMATGNQTGAIGVRSNWRYNRVQMLDNKVYGAEVSYRVQGTRDKWYGAALQAAYELNEPSATATYLDAHYFKVVGPTGLDQGPGTKNLTSSGSPTTIAGHVGSATHFTRASSQFLFHADDPAFDTGWYSANTGFGLSAGVYMDSKPAGDMLIASKWNTTGNQRGYRLYWKQSTDRFVLEVSIDGTAVLAIPATTFGAPSLATWYYVAGVHDATLGTLKISVNAGTQDNLNVALTKAFANTAEFRVGADMQGNYWDGRLQQIRLYAFPVTYTIADVYNAGAWMPYTQMDYEGGRCHTTIAGNLSDGATNTPLSLEQGADDYFDISDNVFKSPGGGNYGSVGTEIIVTSKPNRIVIG